MDSANQAVVFNAIPLLAVAVVYLLASALLAPTLWRDRRRLSELELAVALAFPSVGTATAIFGVLVLVQQEQIGGNVWVSLVAILVALVPGVVLIVRWGERLRPGSRPRSGAEQSPPSDERARVDAFTGALARTTGAEEIGHLLVEAACSLLRLEYAALMLVEGREARGLVAQLDGKEYAPLASLRIDLAAEPSGAASVVFDAAPLVVHDLRALALGDLGLEGLGMKSGAFVPLLSGDDVIAVLGVATSRERRAFSTDELRLLQALSAESALALDRTRSTLALSTALERERLVADISRRLRAKLEVEAALQLAVEAAAPALDASRCYVRLGGGAEATSLGAEWCADGHEPIGERTEQLLVATLAARERRTVAVADVATAAELDDPTLGKRDLLVQLGTKAALATPIVVFDRLIGVLGFHRPQTGSWSEADVALAEAVARELGLVLHTASVIDENARRLRQESALLQSARTLTGELDPDAVLRRLVSEVAKLLEGDAADCYLLEPERNVLRCVAVHGLAADLVGYEVSADRGLSGEALAHGRPIVASAYEQVTDPVPNPAYAAFAHAIVAPVLWAGEPRGVLGVGSRAGGRNFDESDAEVLEAFAGLAALALSNAEAFAERSRQARVQRGFYRIASVLGQTLSLEGTLEAVAQAASEALGGSFAAVLTSRGTRLELAGAHELPPELVEALADGLPVEESALHAAAAERRLLAAPDVPGDDRFEAAWRELSTRAGYRSLLAIPVQARDDEPSGLVIVFFADERRLGEDDLELAEQLASAAQGALERSGRFEDERRRRALAQQLARTGSLLASALDPAAVLDDVVERAPELLGVDACAIRTLEEDEVVVRAAAGEGSESVLGERAPATGWLAGDVVQSGEPLALEDAAADERLRRFDSLLTIGYRAFLGVPLAGPEGGVHGVLSVYDRRPRVWREEEVEALRALAGNASAALRNAQLYQDVALAKEQADAILSNIADAIVAVDREGSVVLWNNAAEAITGVPAAEAVGRTPTQVLGRALDGGPDAPTGDRLVSILRGGEEVWLSVTEAIMRDPAGAASARIYAFRDISSDRFVEQMKSEFVSGVSQELRRPLTSIYGFAETLLRRDVAFGEDERRVFLGYIASESARLTTIVDALLNVARLDSGDLHVTLVPTDVQSVVTDVVATRGPATADGHRFVVDLPDEPLSVEADPDRLRQVLASLVDNALKFSPDGGTVTLAARRRRGAVEVSVADQGLGIPPAEQERIFRKFYRGDAVAARGGAERGTGVGLFIARGLVEKMGGRIRVTSSEGEGSRFSVELPVATGTGIARVNESERQRV